MNVNCASWRIFEITCNHALDHSELNPFVKSCEGKNTRLIDKETVSECDKMEKKKERLEARTIKQLNRITRLHETTDKEAKTEEDQASLYGVFDCII